MRTNVATGPLVMSLLSCALGVGCLGGASGEEGTIERTEEADMAIIGGDWSPSFDHVFALTNSSTYPAKGCSTTAIASQWALTAAHCVIDSQGVHSPASNLFVAGMGQVDAVYPHPSYVSNPIFNAAQLDVALLHIAQVGNFNVTWRGEACPLGSDATLESGCLLTRIRPTGPAALSGQITHCDSAGPKAFNASPEDTNSADFVVDAANVSSPWYVFSANAKGQVHTRGDSGSGCFSPSAPGDHWGELMTVASFGLTDDEIPVNTYALTSDKFYGWVTATIPAAQRRMICGGVPVDDAVVCAGACGEITDACGGRHACTPCPPPPDPYVACGVGTPNEGALVRSSKQSCCNREDESAFLCCTQRSRYARMCTKLSL